MTNEELVKTIKRARTINKGTWFTFEGDLNGSPIRIKAFNKWMQRVEYKGWVDSGPSDCSVKELNDYLMSL